MSLKLSSLCTCNFFCSCFPFPIPCFPVALVKPLLTNIARAQSLEAQQSTELPSSFTCFWSSDTMTLLCELVPGKFWWNNSLNQFLELFCICVLLLYCIVSWRCGCPMVPNSVIYHHREEGHNYTYNQTKIGISLWLCTELIDCCSLSHFFLTVLINKIDMVLFVNKIDKVLFVNKIDMVIFVN